MWYHVHLGFWSLLNCTCYTCTGCDWLPISPRWSMYSKAGMAIFATSVLNSGSGDLNWLEASVLVSLVWLQWMIHSFIWIYHRYFQWTHALDMVFVLGPIECHFYLAQFLLGRAVPRPLRQPASSPTFSGWITLCRLLDHVGPLLPFTNAKIGWVLPPVVTSCHVPTGHCAQFDRSSAAVWLLHGYLHHCQLLNGPRWPVGSSWPHRGIATQVLSW